MENEKEDIRIKKLDDILAMIDEGNAEAITELARRYFTGETVEEDYNKGLELLTRATEKGSVLAKIHLAVCYGEGVGTKTDENLSFKMLKEIVDEYNHPEALYYLAEYYFWGGPVEIDYEQAFHYYNEAVKENPNHLRAKEAIAYSYYSGKGTSKDYEKAFHMYKDLAEKGYEAAYFFLGDFYYIGRNVVEKDYKKAFEYLNKAIECKKNVYASKYYLGEMYLYGRGVDKDYKKAFEYFKEILNEEKDNAYYQLALMYSEGLGVEKDENKAEEYFRKIEIDLCLSCMYYMYGVEPMENYTPSRMLELLDLNMYDIKGAIDVFPIKHPAKLYNDRLKFLTKKEYNDIVNKLKEKIIKYKDDETMPDKLKSVESEDDVTAIAKYIVEGNVLN